MAEPWFDPNLYAWIPGTLLGVAGGLMGGLAGTLVPRGKAKTLVLGMFWSYIVGSALLLAVAVVAYVQGQPYGIWYGLGLPGVIGVLVVGGLLPVIERGYRDAEIRRIGAHDLE
ncbi:MAG: hypothetical protein HY525_05315 [Betaproteobacteria bacterium]|nr:hypothetical protein [Betaproteobacteria bacterium]